jgi:replicative DNA helicase
MNSDLSFFYCLLRDNDPLPLTQIKLEWIDQDYRRVYAFVQAFISRHRKLPQWETVAGKFQLDVDPTTEDIGFFADLIRKRAARLTLEDGILNDLVPMLQNPADDTTFDPLGASAKMMKLCSEVCSAFRVDGTEALDYNHDVGVRIRDYNLRKKMQGRVGVPYPFEPMNLATSGLVGGEGAILFARSGVGKTWFLSLVCNAAVNAGVSVLALSQEMSPAQLSQRIDAVGAGVSPDRLRRGCLSPEEEQRMRDYYTRLKERDADIFMYGPSDISSFEAFEALLLTMRPRVGLVIWDSPYLVIRGEKWENRASFCHSLKQVLVQQNIPLFATWQLNRKGEPALTDAIMTDMDHNFVADDEGIRQLKQMNIFSLKTRSGLLLERMILKWNVINCDFDVLSWRIPGLGDSHESYVVED